LEHKQTLGKLFIAIGYIETASRLCELKLYVIQEGRNEENEERKRKKRLLPLMPTLTFSTALSTERVTYKQQPPRSHKNTGPLV
jgi:hypothetical protein